MATIEEVLSTAVTQHRSGNFVQAKALYEQVLGVDPANLNALHLLAQIESHTRNFDRAVELYRKILLPAPELALVWVGLATACQDAGRAEQSEAAFRRALSLDPALFLALRRYGAMLCAQGGSGQLPRSIALLTRATVVNSTDADTFQDLGVALRYAEYLDEAIAAQWRAIALRPDFAIAFMAQANFINEQGDRDLGLACIRRAMALAPHIPEIYYNHGNIQHTRDQGEIALKMYQRAYLLGMPGALTRVAGVMMDLGRLDEAEAILRRAPDTSGVDVGTAVSLLTEIFVRQNRLEEGAVHFALQGHKLTADKQPCLGECLTAIATLNLEADAPQEAARLISRVAGDSSHLFTVKSIASLRVTLEAHGQRVIRPPAPDPALPRICSSTLATHGRFAHNALEYILIRLYAEKYGYVLETPEWVGGYYFQIDDPLRSRPLRPLYFPRRVINRLLTGDAPFPPISNCDILSPLFLFEHREEYRERVQSWLQPRKVWRPFIDPAMERLRSRGDTVIAIHIRRGDFVKFKYPLTQTAWYVDWLRGIWDTVKNPVLYLASDDLDGVRRDFAQFRPVVRQDVCDPWPGLEYLQDFNVLANADIVGISAASGYSVLAARVNTGVRLCVEPDMERQCIRPFLPWTP